MLGIDARAARAAWSVFLVALAIFLAFAIRRTLLIFVAALLFAYLLSPVVDRVDRLFVRERSRNISLAIVYLALLAVLVTAAIAIGGAVVDQAANLAARIPELVKALDKPLDLPLPAWLTSRKAEIVAAVREQVEQHARDILPVLQRAGVGLLGILGNLPFLVLVPILSFFLLKDGGRIRRAVLEHFFEGSPHRQPIEALLLDVHVLLLLFMRAIVILCFLTFVFYSFFFVIFDVPYPILLATLAGFLEFIPFVGPLSAAVIICVISLISGYPHLLWLILFFIAYWLFQDYVIQPYLMSSGIEMHPLLVIFGVMAGEQIGGIPGMFLSIPVLATARIIVLKFWRT